MSAQSQLRANLLQLLAQHGISQSELGRRCGVQARAINRLLAPEDLAHSPTLETLEALARGLDITVSELLSPEFQAGVPRKAAVVEGGQSVGAQVGAVVNAFLTCADEDRRTILRLAEALAAQRPGKS